MLLSIGRVLFALLFIFSGASKFFDIGSTAQIIEAKIGVPEMLAPYAVELENFAGMTAFRVAAYLVAGVEVICGLMIAFNLAPRVFAVVLVIFVIIATVLVHDFWNQSGGSERLENIIHVLKNTSILGALLMIIGQKPLPPESVAQSYSNRTML